jgi:hypothetical protein
MSLLTFLINLDPDAAIPIDFFVAMSKGKDEGEQPFVTSEQRITISSATSEGDTWKQRNHRIIKFLSESPLS